MKSVRGHNSLMPYPDTKLKHAKKVDYQQWGQLALPWVAGAGIAVGHLLTSTNCSVPKQGSCSACGSCVVALGSLTAWALLKQKQENKKPFYEQ